MIVNAPDKSTLAEFSAQRFITLFPPTYRRLLVNHSVPAAVIAQAAMR